MFFDTADVYGPHTNERLRGSALKGRRDETVIATKFGAVRDASGAFVGINGRPDYVKRCCDGSLKRLGIERIDLYYQHRVDPKVPIEETVGAMSELVEAGKIKSIGLSIRSRRSKRSTRCGRGIRRTSCWIPAANSGSHSWPTARWAGAS